MFICQITGRVSQPGDKQNKIVLATRDRVYTRPIRNEETGKWEIVEVGRGWEIVREVSATDEGLAAWNDLTEDEQIRLTKVL